jgi:hypothetical protein
MCVGNLEMLELGFDDPAHRKFRFPQAGNFRCGTSEVGDALPFRCV